MICSKGQAQLIRCKKAKKGSFVDFTGTERDSSDICCNIKMTRVLIWLVSLPVQTLYQMCIQSRTFESHWHQKYKKPKSHLEHFKQYALITKIVPAAKFRFFLFLRGPMIYTPLPYPFILKSCGCPPNLWCLKAILTLLREKILCF